MNTNFSAYNVPPGKELCVCPLQNQPHIVSNSTWHRHYKLASPDEKDRMERTRDLRGFNLLFRPPDKAAGSASQKRHRDLSSGSNQTRKRSRLTPPPDDRRHGKTPSDEEGYPLEEDSADKNERDRSPPTDRERDKSPPNDCERDQSPPNDAQRDQTPPREQGHDNHQVYALNFPYCRRPNINIDHLVSLATLPDMRTAMQYVCLMRQASLSDEVSKLSEGAIERMRNPPTHAIHIDHGAPRYCISVYLSLVHTSQQAYERVCNAAALNLIDANMAKNLLTYGRMERLIAQYTGVESIEHDMCFKSCVAFTGPYADLDTCPYCDTSRWDQVRLQASQGRTKVGVRQAITIPVGPQLQAQYRNPDSACEMKYLHQRTEQILEEFRASGRIPVIEDIAMGHDYLSAYLAGDVKPNDIVLSISLDGAQLYEKKQSDCWIYVWIIINLAPDKRYRKINVLPGGFIPGPNKPRNIESFLFAGLHHLAALQNEGLTIWDASQNTTFRSDPYLMFITADGPGLVYLDGMVGHTGKNSCRMYCGVLGRRKEVGTHYYPALLMPRDRCIEGSNHDDVDVFNLPSGGDQDYASNIDLLVASPNQTQFESRKTETGLTKAPLILGLSPCRTLGIPLAMTTDIMHLTMNISLLLLGLWRGTVDVGHSDNIDTWDWAVLRNNDLWQAHGKAVERAGSFLPSSFDHKPRNIAEKLTSGYRTWEFQLHTFVIGPALLYGVLPERYWINYCKLVRGFQLISQHRITSDDLVAAHVLLCLWEREFEEIYYQLCEDRLHFVRPCVHQVSHLAKETLLKGPPICYAQWTMERMIRNLGQEIRQPLRPYENLSREGVRRCQINVLLSVMPELDHTQSKSLPATAEDLGGGFVLLRKRDPEPALPTGVDADAIRAFLGEQHPLHPIRRWAKLRLPNGQTAHSAWRELEAKRPDELRVSRNVKITLNDAIRFGEVQYFTRLPINVPAGAGQASENDWTFLDVAIIRLYSAPDPDLLKISSNTVRSCTLLPDRRVLSIKDILSVITMVPHTPTLPSGVTGPRFFMVEKPGLDHSQYDRIEDDDETI